MMDRPYRPRKKSFAGIILSFAVSAMLLLLLIFFLLEPRSAGFETYHQYTVDIGADDDEVYQILCPVPTTSDGYLHKGFSSDVKVLRGDATISVVTSDHGSVLMIKGRGDVNISWSDRWSGSWQSGLTDLSTLHWQGGDLELFCWVYCIDEGISIHLRSTSTILITDGMPRGHSTTRILDGDLTPEGWQLVSVVTNNFALI